ncbi:hypothetical protein Tco_1458897 [Tanacetum coccineum]
MIFRYLKGQPKLGLWYPKDSPFDLVAYTDSDYAGASLDRKSTTGARSLNSLSLSSLRLDLDLYLYYRLVPSCYVIIDLEPLSLSFDFVFSYEIFKSFSLRSVSPYDLVSWYRHAHDLESLLKISLGNICLDNLDIYKEDLEY